jgi:hypothetical protein
VADARFDLPLAIGMADAARERDDAVVREHVAVSGVSVGSYTSAASTPREQPHGLAAVAEREDEEPGAPVLRGLRMAHHGAVAVIDLRLFAGRRQDHRVGVGRRGGAQPMDDLHVVYYDSGNKDLGYAKLDVCE